MLIIMHGFSPSTLDHRVPKEVGTGPRRILADQAEHRGGRFIGLACLSFLATLRFES